MRWYSACRGGTSASAAAARRQSDAQRRHGLPGCKRAPGADDDLVRAQQPLAIGRPQARGHRGIQPGELGMKCRRTQRGEPRPGGAANIGGNVRNRRETMQQGMQIQPGAADHDRGPPLRQRLADRRPRQLQPAPGRRRICRIQDAVQPVRRARLVLGGRAGRENAQIAVQLHAVGVDDHAALGFGQTQRQGRLAAGRRAGHDNQAGHGTAACMARALRGQSAPWLTWYA